MECSQHHVLAIRTYVYSIAKVLAVIFFFFDDKIAKKLVSKYKFLNKILMYYVNADVNFGT